MAKLSFDESDVLERVISLKSGYVLDFTNRTFSNFVSDVIGVEPYSGEYEKHGTSKAKILRSIIETESDTTVSKLILALLDREKRFPNLDAYPIVTDSDRNSAQGIALRLAGQHHTKLPTLTLACAHDVFRRVRGKVENCITSKAYDAGLDRLHTFLTMYLRLLVAGDAGNTPPHDVPLHSLMGLYVKGLQTTGRRVSEMTLRILRSSTGVLRFPGGIASGYNWPQDAFHRNDGAALGEGQNRRRDRTRRWRHRSHSAWSYSHCLTRDADRSRTASRSAARSSLTGG
jgi:hypothetical protein